MSSAHDIKALVGIGGGMRAPRGEFYDTMKARKISLWRKQCLSTWASGPLILMKTFVGQACTPAAGLQTRLPAYHDHYIYGWPKREV
jgi:hypothetical protein